MKQMQGSKIDGIVDIFVASHKNRSEVAKCSSSSSLDGQLSTSITRNPLEGGHLGAYTQDSSFRPVNSAQANTEPMERDINLYRRPYREGGDLNIRVTVRQDGPMRSHNSSSVGGSQAAIATALEAQQRDMRASVPMMRSQSAKESEPSGAIVTLTSGKLGAKIRARQLLGHSEFRRVDKHEWDGRQAEVRGPLSLYGPLDTPIKAQVEHASNNSKVSPYLTFCLTPSEIN
jgi:hypothetical protein